jgi:hypothetical protein
MKIAIAIKINTGNTSKKPIIVDRVSVVANPIKNDAASIEPSNVVNFCIYLLHSFSNQLATPKNL